MDQSKLDLYLMSHKKYFPQEKLMYVTEKLRTMDEQKFLMAQTIELKNPTVIFVVSLFLGWLGIDRFMLGHVGMGILKLLTMGGFGFIAIYDWFVVAKKAREINFNTFMSLL